MDQTSLLNYMSVIPGIIAAVAAIYVAIKQESLKRKDQKIESRTKELIVLYKDIQTWHKIEDWLVDLAGVSGKDKRNGNTLSTKSESAHVAKRINELENQLK